jgi:hypothetical protein
MVAYGRVSVCLFDADRSGIFDVPAIGSVCLFDDDRSGTGAYDVPAIGLLWRGVSSVCWGHEGRSILRYWQERCTSSTDYKYN